MSDDGTFIELDARNRASLGKLAGPHRRFLARVEPGGVIVMTPATVVPLGAPAGAAERARVEAEKLPTVGRWTDPTDNIGTGGGVTAGPPVDYRDQVQDISDEQERLSRNFWLDASDGEDDAWNYVPEADR